MNKFYKAILAITAINYAMMLFYTMPKLWQASGGMLIFDLRVAGYSTETAQAFLDAISAEGRQLYLTTQHMLDTIFPALLAVSLIVTLYRLAPKLPVLYLTPIAGALFDYYENAAVREMLLSKVADPALVEMASLLTNLKFASIALSFLSIIWLWQRRKTDG